MPSPEHFRATMLQNRWNGICSTRSPSEFVLFSTNPPECSFWDAAEVAEEPVQSLTTDKSRPSAACNHQNGHRCRLLTGFRRTGASSRFRVPAYLRRTPVHKPGFIARPYNQPATCAAEMVAQVSFKAFH